MFSGPGLRGCFRMSCGSDLAHEVDTRFKGCLALFPLGRTYLAVVGGHELGGLDLAEQFLGITADAVVLNLDELDESFGIAYKRAAVGHAVFLDHHAEGTAEQARGVGQHRVLDFLDALRGIVPCLVHEMRVCADRIDLYAKAFEVLVFVGHILELCRAYECEVSGVEEENRPFAEHILVGHGLELAVMVGLNLEFGNVC